MNTDEDEIDSDDESDAVGFSGRNYITPYGEAKLRQELTHLLNTERPRLVETVAWAASNGDRSENADYIYGKRRLREIDRRVRFLTKRLEAAVVVVPEQQKSDRVLFGATVVVEDQEGTQHQYSIVGVDEADADRGWISWVSPIAKALLQLKVDDTAVVRLPKGEKELTVLSIRYVSIIAE